MILGWILKLFGGGIVDRVIGYFEKQSADDVETAKVAAHLKENREGLEAHLGVVGIKANAEAEKSTNLFVADSVAILHWVIGISVALFLLPQAAWYAWQVVYNWNEIAALPPMPFSLWHLLATGGGYGVLSVAKRALK